MRDVYTCDLQVAFHQQLQSVPIIRRRNKLCRRILLKLNFSVETLLSVLTLQV